MTPKFPIPGLHESKLALKFVHPDPVLGAHLARQQMTMVGRDMLDFIHPDERDRKFPTPIPLKLSSSLDCHSCRRAARFGMDADET